MDLVKAYKFTGSKRVLVGYEEGTDTPQYRTDTREESAKIVKETMIDPEDIEEKFNAMKETFQTSFDDIVTKINSISQDAMGSQVVNSLDAGEAVAVIAEGIAAIPGALVEGLPDVPLAAQNQHNGYQNQENQNAYNALTNAGYTVTGQEEIS